MKKLLQMKVMLLLCALIAGSGSVWAADGVATLPFNWNGGTSSDFLALEGVSANGLGTDYAASNAPYRIKLDTTGDYIVIHTNIQPNVVSIDVKMLGGANTSSITVQGSSDGESYSDIETLSISGKQNTILTLTTTKSFASSDRYVKLYFTRGSNVGVGPISITKMPSALSSIAVSGTPDDFNLGDTWNTTGITVTATYSDASTDNVTAKASFTGYDKSQAGDQTISVSYTENEVTKNTSYDIYVNDFTGLSLSGTYKTEFWTNDEFSHDGVVVKAEFENDNEKEVSGATFSTPDMTSSGTKTVTVSYTIEGVEQSTSYDITVSDKPKYTITWMVDGEKNKSKKITMDESLSSEFPSVSAINGKDFMGWVTTATVASDYSGGYVNTSAETAKEDKTYYAVFAAKESGNVTDDLTRETTGVNNNGGYSSWSGKTGTSGAVYAGLSAGGNDAIQLRSKDSNSGVITTTSGGKVTKVKVTWASDTTDGRTLNVYGKNTAYSAATDLYNASNQGTLLGTIVYGTSTDLTIDGDYEYIGVRSNEGALYLDKLSITWYGEVYSNYTTTATDAYTVSTNTDRYYGSYVTAKNLDFKNAEGITAYIAKGFNNSKNAIVLQEVDVVPAGTAIIVKTDEKGGSADVEVTNDDASDVSENALVAGDGTTAWNGTDGYTYYYLASDLFHKATSGTLQSGKAYLKVANGDVPAGAHSFGFIFDDEEATGINTVAKDAENGQFFNLAGQRVAQPTKGLYIVNGRKVIVK